MNSLLAAAAALTTTVLIASGWPHRGRPLECFGQRTGLPHGVEHPEAREDDDGQGRTGQEDRGIAGNAGDGRRQPAHQLAAGGAGRHARGTGPDTSLMKADSFLRDPAARSRAGWRVLRLVLAGLIAAHGWFASWLAGSLHSATGWSAKAYPGASPSPRRSPRSRSSAPCRSPSASSSPRWPSCIRPSTWSASPWSTPRRLVRRRRRPQRRRVQRAARRLPPLRRAAAPAAAKRGPALRGPGRRTDETVPHRRQRLHRRQHRRPPRRLRAQRARAGAGPGPVRPAGCKGNRTGARQPR